MPGDWQPASCSRWLKATIRPAEKKAERKGSTFAELAEDYVNRYAKKKTIMVQADALVHKHLSRVGKLPATDITRADVKAVMARVTAPIVANQVLAAASAMFS